MPVCGWMLDDNSPEILPQPLLIELFASAPEGIVILDSTGRVVCANQEFCRMFGYPAEEVAERPLEELIATGEPLQEQAALGVEDRAPIGMEAVRRRKDGSLVQVSILGGRFDSSEPAGFLIYRDTTAQKQAEQDLRERQERIRAMAETAPAAIYIHTEDRFLFVNQASEAISGYSRDELLAMGPFALVHPEHRALLQERWAQCMHGGAVPSRYEFKLLTKSGSERWLDFSGMMVHLRGQKAVLAVAFDVTDRKRAEQLQAALYEIAQHANHARDLQALYASVHSVVARVLCCDNFHIVLREQATGLLQSPYFVDEAECPSVDGRLTEYVLRTGAPLVATREMLNELADGEGERPVPTAWLGIPLKHSDEILGVLAVQSYTQDKAFDQRDQEFLTFAGQHVASAIRHKRREESLRVSEQRYRSLFQRSVYGVYRASVEGRIIDANPAMAAMLGYHSPSDLIGANLETDVYTDVIERRHILAKFSREQRNTHEARWKRKDGSIITVRLSGAIAQNSTGEPDTYEVIVEDITERRDIEEQLRHAQKMEAIGRLAGGLAHDFNNLLTVIKGYSDLLLDRFPPGDRGRLQLEEVRKAADRAAALTGHLLAFSRRQVLAPRVLNINQTIASMEKMLRRVLAENIELRTMLDPHLGNVKTDPGQLEQVLMNLVVNARDAMPDGGQIIIDTGNVTVSESEHTMLAPGRYVMLAITDTGVGMDADTRSHAFEPFFTTKQHGTGLGLSTVYGIAKQSGGDTAIRSEPGKGTTVKVYLPRVEEALEARPQAPPEAPEFHGTETILLVEDEDSVRPLVKEMLRRQGYLVLETGSGEEALAVSQRHGGPIHLLLTDVVLKKASGWQVSAQLVAQRPEMRVLFMSGYSEETMQTHGIQATGAPLLPKPFTARALAEQVRRVLDDDGLGNAPVEADERR